MISKRCTTLHWQRHITITLAAKKFKWRKRIFSQQKLFHILYICINHLSQNILFNGKFQQSQLCKSTYTMCIVYRMKIFGVNRLFGSCIGLKRSIVRQPSNSSVYCSPKLVLTIQPIGMIYLDSSLVSVERETIATAHRLQRHIYNLILSIKQ